MDKNLFALISFLLINLVAVAQTKDEKIYKERAAEIQNEVWNNGDKAFDARQAPEKYKNESAVVLAKSVEVTNSTKRKFKMTTIFGGTVKQYKYFTTFRERVLINDKSALENFSTLNYKKITDNSVREGGLKFKDISKTYIGVKIFKQAGKEVNITPDDEEVLTRNTDKKKEGKLAIPDLQIGDILDYYIRIEEVVEATTEVRGPDLFFLGGEYPILYYNVKYILDKKCGADIMSMNGAKPMSETSNSDDDILLEFTETDLPKINSTLWTSQPRQIPYHVVRYGFSGADIIAEKGKVKRGPFTDIYKKNLKERFITQIAGRIIDFSPEKAMEEYFGGKKAVKELPSDSIVNYLYNYFHWMQYGSFGNMDVSNQRNYTAMNWYNLAVSFSEILRDYDIENDIVVVCNRYSGRLKEVFGIGDFETFVKVNSGGKFTWICFNDFFQNTGQLAADYQGEDALVLTRGGKDKMPKYALILTKRGIMDRMPKYADSETPIKLPVSKSSENVLAENLNVIFNKENLQLITIERITTETGSMKQADQKRLLLSEDVEAEFAALINKKKNVDVIASKKKGNERGNEIQAAFDKERLKQKDYFNDEIKEQYDQEPKDLISYRINNAGLAIQNPSFEFTEKFTMENFVKKAGNNYILDAGKLMGTYKKLEDKERIRTLDIFMPSARTLNYTFNITVPEGYTIKGVEELNKKVTNDIASFTSSASLNGNAVIVTVSRSYNNNFEPVANWSKLLTVMDAAADFTNMKLLLEKKK